MPETYQLKICNVVLPGLGSLSSAASLHAVAKHITQEQCAVGTWVWVASGTSGGVSSCLVSLVLLLLATSSSPEACLLSTRQASILSSSTSYGCEVWGLGGPFNLFP